MKINLNDLQIIPLKQEDVLEIAEAFTFPWSSFEATKEKWQQYMLQHSTEERLVFLAKWEGKWVGYGSLIRHPDYPPFRAAEIPEINDLRVLEEHRGAGFGTRLIQYLEGLAQVRGYTQIGIGVGLYKDYGRAQKLYIQLGYVPDGEGVTYCGQPTVPGESYPLDDELILWMKKPLFPT